MNTQALQIALFTLKERCQKLQNSLHILEEENIQLKKKEIEGKFGTFNLNEEDSSIKSKIDQLQDNISSLTKENNLLKKRLTLATNENKHLWYKLSKLTETNQYMGNQLNAISTTLKKHSSKTELNTFDTPESPKHKLEDDGKLEEISLKIIHGILKEKQELESQCAEMTEIQNNYSSFTISDFGISFYDPSESLLLEDLKQHVENLNKFKYIIKDQGDSLKNTLDNLEKIQNGMNICNICKDRAKLKSLMTSTETQTIESNIRWMEIADFGEQLEHYLNINQVAEPPAQEGVEDRLCPICSKFFPSKIIFEEYHKHVLQCLAQEPHDNISLNE